MSGRVGWGGYVQGVSSGYMQGVCAEGEDGYVYPPSPPPPHVGLVYQPAPVMTPSGSHQNTYG